jgi:hypothetical protein
VSIDQQSQAQRLNRHASCNKSHLRREGTHQQKGCEHDDKTRHEQQAANQLQGHSFNIRMAKEKDTGGPSIEQIVTIAVST